MEVLGQIIAAPVFLIVMGVAGGLLIAKFTPWHRFKIGALEMERDSPSRPYIAQANEAVVDSRSAKLDLEQFGEVTGALDVLVRASGVAIETVAREWFSMLATRLAMRLKEERDDHYRVAIWIDDPQYDDRFICVGHGLFNKDDVDMDSLERGWTIGGIAFESANMTYYCRDRRTDPRFKPRKSIPPTFESVFGLALGTITNRWGVMTVDARKANGFPEHAQWLIRRFAELASLGAIVWERAVATVPGPTATPPGPPDGL